MELQLAGLRWGWTCGRGTYRQGARQVELEAFLAACQTIVRRGRASRPGQAREVSFGLEEQRVHCLRSKCIQAILPPSNQRPDVNDAAQVDCRDGTEFYSAETFQFILSPSPTATNQLLLEAGKWNSELHNEIWVFDGGYWDKSSDLWESIHKASWSDVILEKSMKDKIIGDVDDFFNSRETYENLKVPWKRGVVSAVFQEHLLSCQALL